MQTGTGSAVPQEYVIDGSSGRIGTFYRQDNVYAYELRDQTGNVRAVVAKSGSSLEVRGYSDYYPYGMVLRSGGTDYRYGYQGAYAEKDGETDWNAFELRMYDSRIARWMSVDPKHQYSSPYVGMGDNPISGVDKDGGSDHPIYDPTNGNLLGTDDLGLQGDAIFMTKATFDNLGGQNMSHTLSETNNLGFNSLSSNPSVVSNFFNNPFTGYNNLSQRPDWDGFMTYPELVQWGKDNNHAPVYLDASKIDLGNISVSDFPGIGKSAYINTVGKNTPLDTYGPWGTNYMTLISSSGKVKLHEDSFDYRQHSWGNIFASKGKHFWYELLVRRPSIAFLQMYHGVDNDYGFAL